MDIEITNEFGVHKLVAVRFPKEIRKRVVYKGDDDRYYTKDESGNKTDSNFQEFLQYKKLLLEVAL